MSAIPADRPIGPPADFVEISRHLLAKNRGDYEQAAEDAAWRCVYSLQERGTGRTTEEDDRLLGWAAAYAAAAQNLSR